MSKSSRNAENVIDNKAFENLEQRYTFSSNSNNPQINEIDYNSDRILSSLSKMEQSPQEIISSENTKIYGDRLFSEKDKNHIYIIDYADSIKNKDEIRVDNTVKNFSIESKEKTFESDVIRLKRNLDGEVRDMERDSVKEKREFSIEDDKSNKSKHNALSFKEQAIISDKLYNNLDKSNADNVSNRSKGDLNSVQKKDNEHVGNLSVRSKIIEDKYDNIEIRTIKDVSQKQLIDIDEPKHIYDVKVQSSTVLRSVRELSVIDKEENIEVIEDKENQISPELIVDTFIIYPENQIKVNIENISQIKVENDKLNIIDEEVSSKEQTEQSNKLDNKDNKSYIKDCKNEEELEIQESQNIKSQIYEQDNFRNTSINNRYNNLNVEDLDMRRSVESINRSKDKRNTYNIGKLKLVVPTDFSDDISISKNTYKNQIYSIKDFSIDLYSLIERKLNLIYRELFQNLIQRNAVNKIADVIYNNIQFFYKTQFINHLLKNRDIQMEKEFMNKQYIIKKSFNNLIGKIKEYIKMKKINAYKVLRSEQYKRYLNYKLKAKIFTEFKDYCYYRKKWIDEIQKEIKKNTIL
jgi:hypothetical protein